MNLAIVHYHLNRGGVTQVIANQLLALDTALKPGERWRVAILYGGRREGWPESRLRALRRLDLELVTIPELDYDTPDSSAATRLDGGLAARLRALDFSADDTIVHAHNHALGKNASLPASLSELAADGYPLLFQIHDFTEDFRSANYAALLASVGGGSRARLAAALYPQAPHVHYAVLNRRDRRALAAAGVAESQLHYLPNPVSEFDGVPPREASRHKLADRFGVPVGDRFCLYPVRGIRRKNLGELLLWSALADGDTWFGLTLPPLNPVEVPSYTARKQLAARNRLRCVFETGNPEGLSFVENLSAADAVITTSVAEGFGMTFLETWLVDRPLVGRDLPDITADFVGHGLMLDGLAPRVNIPIGWIGEEPFREELERAYRTVLDAYGLPHPSREAYERGFAEKIVDGYVDFGDLATPVQGRVVERVADSPSDASRLRGMNPRIDEALARAPNNSAETIAHNAEVVRREFSLEAGGRRLRELYRTMAECPRSANPTALAEGERLLETFLDFTRFRPLRASQ